MRRPNVNFSTDGIASRIVPAIFGFAFAGVGITVIGFLWLTPFNEFGSPPLFFRIFGSFIALCFIGLGGGVFFAAISGRSGQNPSVIQDSQAPSVPTAPQTSTLNYACPKCGAQLGPQPDVSPLGDAKCAFCHQWFNIHRPGSPS